MRVPRWGFKFSKSVGIHKTTGRDPVDIIPELFGARYVKYRLVDPARR